MNNFAKFAKWASEKIYNTFGKSSGKMLLATSMIGISMSSFIQAMAVLVNDKYTMSQKAFMVPQELGDAMLSIVSIFAITKPTQRLMSKLVKTGKVMPKNILRYMEENKMIQKRGKTDFDFEKEVKNILQTIEKSDKFIKSNEKERTFLVNPHKNILENYEEFQDSASAVATTIAGITSTCLVVPLLRNTIASHYQKKHIDFINNNPVNPVFKDKNLSSKSLFRI